MFQNEGFNDNIQQMQDLFHVYLNRFEFHFLQLHINKTNQLCFLKSKGHVLLWPNRQNGYLKHKHNRAAKNTHPPPFK